MKTTLCQCQNKEVVSVTINVFVNSTKTHPNGSSFSSSHGLYDASKKDKRQEDKAGEKHTGSERNYVMSFISEKQKRKSFSSSHFQRAFFQKFLEIIN